MISGVGFGQADLYPSARCSTSNQAEIFYGRVPDPQGSVGDTVNRQALRDYYPSLIAHEVTHLVQGKAQVFENAGRKTAWEREGGATLAEQLVAYRLFGHGSGQELGWSAATGSDERWGWYGSGSATWLRSSDEIGVAIAPGESPVRQRSAAGLAGNETAIRAPVLGSGKSYGVPSMVLRYAMDRWGEDYPGGERALVRRFTQSPARGFASLVDVSPDKSWGPEAIFTGFYITLWLDLPRLDNIRHDHLGPSRHLRQVTGELATQTLYLLLPHPRLTGRRVRAGSTLYFHWTPTGTLSPTSIKVTSPGGGRGAQSHLRVGAAGAVAGRAPIPRPARRGRTRRSPPFRLGGG